MYDTSIANQRALRQSVYRHHFRAHPVLVVDDDPDDRELFLTLMKSIRGKTFPVVPIKSGQALLDYLANYEKTDMSPESFEREMPGMIFLDLCMPEMDGIETLRQVRQKPLWHTIPITIITHSSDDSSIEKALKEGANAFMPKPYTKLELFAAIKRTNNFSVIDL